MGNTRENKLATGSIGKLMLQLAIPAVVAQIVNVLYNIIDKIYIGNMADVGDLALTGLGLCFPIIILVAAFSYLFGMGGAPKAAIEMGRGNNDKAEKILGNSTSLLVCSSLVLTAIVLIWGKPLLYLFGASDATITYAWQYLQIYAVGTIFVQLSLGLNLFITTQGFAKTSMLTVLIGAVCNIILDPIFIYALDMGVQGAALATIISQAISATWVVLFLTSKKSKLKIKLPNMLIDWRIMLSIMALGVSPFVMQATESILNICFNSQLSAFGGDTAVGAMTIIASMSQMILLPLQGLTQGGQPIISYNYGHGNMQRVKSAIKLQFIICFSFSIAACAIVELCAPLFVSIFTTDTALQEMATWTLRLYMAGIWIFGAQVACQQAFVALGKAGVSLLLACLRKIVLLIPLIFILPLLLENQVFAIFLAEPIADILAALVTMTIFFISMRSIFKQIDRTTPLTAKKLPK